MSWLITKYLITAAIVVLVSEVAKRSDKLGAFLASLPLITILVLVWMYIEKQPLDKLSSHAWYTLWYVIPTLPMFVAFPYLLPRWGFWVTLVACILLTTACFAMFGLILRRFGIDLF